MKITIKIVFFLLICSVPASCNLSQNHPSVKAGATVNKPTEEVLVYRGTSDSSAAIGLSEKMFIVADDENNVLRVYRIKGAGLPVYRYDLTDFLNIYPEHPEADIEGATMIGDTIYWISSHGRNKDGKIRPNRYRFFATSVKVENEKVTIRPVGMPCRSLIQSLLETKYAQQTGLDKATRFDEGNLTKTERKLLAPKRAGLNIEGLCASADGKTIYIGFRNPRPFDRSSPSIKAIVIALNNPREVIERRSAPKFGEPMLWNFGGLGIRSMEYSDFHKAFFIIAGPYNEGLRFALYRWSGEQEREPVLVRELSRDISNFKPEALICFKNSDKFLLLSDDGSIAIKVSSPSECEEGELNADGTCLNKYLTNPNKKTFRGIWLTP
ncbi:MAG: DUF3616 domain-containing protein [Phycisphaerae bacterium]|nr:DUF3616 domain-containing protein [Phycisphaerae bacterium]NIP52340.1 DUF3616 domain-containing protein [Phycisphaerae bacterium]NIS51331.1 DUF3616 domain-containing protein [Phycisphaerae bacterium]NIU08943.1 DUF3616 domain-containing protein [Phycisphaerae bacterium]NIU56612.1 DUF3616 domain-containing protein [Phycisphaerae bacterium]